MSEETVAKVTEEEIIEKIVSEVEEVKLSKEPITPLCEEPKIKKKKMIHRDEIEEQEPEPEPELVEPEQVVEPLQRIHASTWNKYLGWGIYVKKTNFKMPQTRLEYDVDLHPLKMIATFKCKQVFETKKGEGPKEIVFKFAKSNNYKFIINDVEMVIRNKDTKEEKRFKADIKGKEEAQEEYDDVIAEGKTAMLMERDLDRTISLNLGNIQENREVEVNVNGISELTVDKFDRTNLVHVKFEVKKVHKKLDNKILKFNVNINLPEDSKGIIHHVRTSQPKENVEFEKKGEKSVSFHTKEDMKINEDFFVIAKIKSLPLASWIVEKVKPDLYSHFFSIFTHVKKRVYPEFIVLIDRSYSMKGDRIKNAKEALKLFMQSLDDDLRFFFNIISYGSRFQPMFKKSSYLTEKSLTFALKQIGKMSNNMDGTNMLKPLEFVLSTPVRDKYDRTLFLITDGEDKKHEKILGLLKKHDVRVFTLGIGDKTLNPEFLNKIATQTGAKSIVIKESNQVQSKVMELLKAALPSALKSCTYKFPENLTVVDDKTLPDSMLHHKHYKQFFFSKDAPKEEDIIDFSFTHGKDKSDNKIKPRVIETSKTISTVVGKRRINHLEKTNAKSEEIKELGLNLNLITSKTSYIVVSDDINNEAIDKEMEKITIPSKYYKVERPPQPLHFFSRKYQRKDDRRRIEVEKRRMEEGKMKDWIPKMNLQQNRAFSGTHGEDWEVNPNQKQSKAFSGTHGMDWTPLETKEKKFDAFFGKKKEEEVKKKFKKKRKGSQTKNFNIPRKPQRSISSSLSSLVSHDDNDDDSDDDYWGEEEKEEEIEEEPEMESNVAADERLTNLLFKASIKGLWKESSDLNVLLGKICRARLAVIKDKNPKSEEDLIFWISAVVMEIIKGKFPKHSIQWGLILKKTKKAVVAKGYTDLFAKAKKFYGQYC